MTTKQQQDERLAVAVNDIATIKDDIREIKDNGAAQSKKFDEVIDAMDKRFVTRAELRITQWVFGFIISAAALYLNFSNHIK